MIDRVGELWQLGCYACPTLVVERRDHWNNSLEHVVAWRFQSLADLDTWIVLEERYLIDPEQGNQFLGRAGDG